MHMYITLTINSCNATSDVLEQEECITKLIMQAALIFWYKYQKKERILIVHELFILIKWFVASFEFLLWKLHLPEANP